MYSIKAEIVAPLQEMTANLPLKIQLGDTLQISDIQFLPEEVVINKEIFFRKTIVLNMISANHTLKEIFLREPKNMARALNLPNADKEPMEKIDRRLNFYSQQPTAVVILATLLGQSGGIDDLYNIISGNRKRDRKLKSLYETDRINAIYDSELAEIREHFSDLFFTNTLGIRKENINEFLWQCDPQKIIKHFNEERYLEITDIFVMRSSNFNAGKL
ncbi:MAG: hypothetical protein U5K51_15685 [Flavobacteriaceae bacterium]|nr:hypothetical protein [Flavobacteriaceae bacterium]